MERIIREIIVELLEANAKMNIGQHSYRKRRCYLSQLFAEYDHIHRTGKMLTSIRKIMTLFSIS